MCIPFFHQLDETFLVELFNEDGSKELIEEPSSVNITITENDDPYGVFSFAAGSLSVAIGEFGDLLIRTSCSTYTSSRMSAIFNRCTSEIQTTLMCAFNSVLIV